MPLKSADDILTAFNHMLSSGLCEYLDHFIAPFVGYWSTRFFTWEIAYSNKYDCPSITSVAPFIGPLHVSSTLENVLS